MIREEETALVLGLTDLVDLVGETIPLTRWGRTFRGVCPFHGGTNPTFTVSRVPAVYHCFTCEESGNAATFVEKTLGVDYPTAIRILARRCGVPLDG